MNPFMTSQMYSMHRDTSSKRSCRTVSIMDNGNVMTHDLATTLFLGDLSVICDETNLYESFSRFGAIESVQLKHSDHDPQRAHLGFGFIKFVTRDSAERALQEMNGYFFLGRAMRVGWALDFGKKGSQSLTEQASDRKKNQTAQIHVMFVTRELNRRVSELDIGAVFSRYGNLEDVAIKKNAINHAFGVQSGYAFLHYALTPEGLRSALTAVDEGNMLVVEGITYRCKVTHSMQTHLAPMKQKRKNLGLRYLPPSLTHVFPSSLDDSTFETYNSSSKHSPSSTMIDYHEANFPSYSMHPSKAINQSEQYYEVLPPPLPSSVHDLLYVKTNKPVTAPTADLIYPGDNGPSDDYPALSQNNPNHHHYVHTRPSSLSTYSTYSSYANPSVKKI